MGEMLGVGEMATRIMKEEGIECGFGVPGYHSEPVIALFPHYGMKLYTMHHEQSGPYAADGYTGASRKMAICYGTAGPGVTNAISGIAQAYQNQRPMLFFAGMHGATVDGHWSLQEAYPTELLRSITKLVYQINNPEVLPYWLRRAIRTARQYPPGPTSLVTPLQALLQVLDTDRYIYTCPTEKVSYPSPTWGDPQTVEKAVRMILDAKRPVLVAGEGVFWAHAEKELQEFVDLTQTPVSCRRGTRGSVSEYHPLALGPGTRSQFMDTADLYVLIGMRDSITEAHFQGVPFGLYQADVPFIQICEVAQDFVNFHPTPVAILGNARSVLKQMTDCARDLLKGKKPDRGEKLVTEIAESRKGFWDKINSDAEKERNKNQVTLASWRKGLHDFLESVGNATVILDSFTGSYATSDMYNATFPGQSLDAGGWSGVGHGLAMGFGVQVAKPGHPVLVIMGDAGMGIGGMEVETCARYKAPVVSIIWNNSEWMGGTYELIYRTVAGDNTLQKDIRYHDMFGILEDVHSELVTKPEELVPALERSFNSGKPAVINALIAPGQTHPWIEGIPVGYYRGFGIERARQVLPRTPDDASTVFEAWFENRYGVSVETQIEPWTIAARFMGT